MYVLFTSDFTFFGMAPKRSAKVSTKPACRFRSKLPCGSNGKPVHKKRGGRGRPYMGGQRASVARRKATQNESNRVNMASSRSAFRLQTRTYGLTLSDAGSISSKEAVHEWLQQMLGVHHCCVSRELHENGEQHFHVSGKLDNRIDITDCHFFDYTCEDGTVYHPNIIKGGPAWLNYVMKALDYITTYPIRKNVMADALACNSTERALDHIMTNDASAYVRFGTAIEANLRRHFKRTCPDRLPRWFGPYPAGRYPIDWNSNTHALHIWGPPGSGKTCFAQHLLRELYGDCEYAKCHVEGLRTLTFTKPFVFDEAMFLLHDSAISREITDVVSGGVIHARYNSITIPPGVARVFVSNQRWVFKNPDDSVYGRRLIQFEMPFSCPIEEWRVYNGPMNWNPPRSPSPPPPPPGSPPPGNRSPPPPPPYPKQPPPLPPPVPEVDESELDHEYFSDADDELVLGGDTFASLTTRWSYDAEAFEHRPRPSQAPAIGAAPVARSPLVPMPETPHWSPGWSPLLPFDDVFDMDIDPFLLDNTIVDREDL